MGLSCSNITYPDENLTAYVNRMMGPRCLDPRVTNITVALYSLILASGCLGNLFTCLIIWRNNYMHTATNYYLFSLAVSDLISLVLGLPFELNTTLTFLWPDILPESVCKLRSFVTETTSCASVLTITAFSVERWLAICFPLKVKLFSKLDRAVKVIILIWTIACISATPIAFFAILNRIELPEKYRFTASITDRYPRMISNVTDVTRAFLASLTDDGRTIKGTDVCALDFSRPRVSAILLSFSFYCFFLLPMLTICILYVHIGITVRIASKTQERMTEAKTHDAKRLRRRMTVVRMLVAVVVCFFTCWLPFHIQRLSSLYFDMNNMSPEMTHFFHMVFFVSGYFYYANSAVNPLLYNVLNARFRQAFLQTLRVCRKRSKGDSQQQHILELSANRSTCSNIACHSRAVSVAGGSPFPVSASFLAASHLQNRRTTLPSKSSPVCRHSRTDSRRYAKLSAQSVAGFTSEENQYLRPPATSASTGTFLHDAQRRRSRTCDFLKPPNPRMERASDVT